MNLYRLLVSNKFNKEMTRMYNFFWNIPEEFFFFIWQLYHHYGPVKPELKIDGWNAWYFDNMKALVSEWVSDCSLTPIQQFFSYIVARTSWFSMRWWWGPLCTRPTCWVGFLMPNEQFFFSYSWCEKVTFVEMIIYGPTFFC